MQHRNSNNPGILQSGFIWGEIEFAGKFGVLSPPSIFEMIRNQETVHENQFGAEVKNGEL